jgi:hypothetical protein
LSESQRGGNGDTSPSGGLVRGDNNGVEVGGFQGWWRRRALVTSPPMEAGEGGRDPTAGRPEGWRRSEKGEVEASDGGELKRHEIEDRRSIVR